MDNNFSDILGIFKKLNEGTMDSAEQHSKGPKFTGYWKGTDKATPGNKMVGGSCEESTSEPMSLADKLKARWEETKREKGLAEAGANNPAQGTTAGTPGAAPTPPTPQELAATQQNVNKLKSAGVPIANTTQAAQTALKDPTNPATPINAQDKKIDQTLGNTMSNLLAKGNPSQVGQLANIIKQAQQGQS